MISMHTCIVQVCTHPIHETLKLCRLAYQPDEAQNNHTPSPEATLRQVPKIRTCKSVMVSSKQATQDIAEKY